MPYQQNKRSDTALDLVKTGLYIFLGWQAIKVISAVAKGVTEPRIDSGTSQNTCDYNADLLSYPEEQYSDIADDIQSAIWETGPFALYERDEVIASALMAMQNRDDLKKLRCVYNIRGAKDAMSARLNLVQSVEKYLDQNYKDAVNADYYAKGIPLIIL